MLAARGRRLSGRGHDRQAIHALAECDCHRRRGRRGHGDHDHGARRHDRSLIIRNTGDSLDREDSGVSVTRSSSHRCRNNVLRECLFGVFLRTAPDSMVTGNVSRIQGISMTADKGDGIRLWESERTVVETTPSMVVATPSSGSPMGSSFRTTRSPTDATASTSCIQTMPVVEGNVLTGNSVGRVPHVRPYPIAGQPHGEEQRSERLWHRAQGHGRRRDRGQPASSGIASACTSTTARGPSTSSQYPRNLFAYNDIGVLFLPSVKRNEFSRTPSSTTRSRVGYDGSGNILRQRLVDRGVGNYWSDFAGYDADGDGVGDIAYYGSTISTRRSPINTLSWSSSARPRRPRQSTSPHGCSRCCGPVPRSRTSIPC